MKDRDPHPPAAVVVTATAMAAASAEVTRSVGRGVLYITAAKLFFIVSGYAIHFALPRLLDAPDDTQKTFYGLYGLVSSVLNVLATVVVQGSIQGVSKLVSEEPARAADVRSAALRVQATLGGGISLAYFLLANAIADWQSRPDAADYYRVSTAVILCYGFYAVFIGVLNGRREFRKQAFFDMSYATLKTALIVGAAAAGFSVMGVMTGFSLAAAAVMIAAALVVGMRGGVGGWPLRKRLYTMMIPLMLYTFVLNLLLSVDLWILGAVSPMSSAGDYTAAQVIARIPYQAMLSVTFVVFPLISRSTFEGDRETTQGYVRVTLRYSLIALGGMVSVIGAAASDVIVVPYPEVYRSAGPTLAVLSTGMLFFALFTIIGSMLNGAGRTTLALALGLVTLGVDVGLCYALIPSYGPIGAGYATTGAMGVGSLLGLSALWRRFGAGLPLWTIARVALAAGAVVGVAWVLPPTGRLITIAKCLLLMFVYAAVLLASRELGRGDLARVRKVFARRAAPREV